MGSCHHRNFLHYNCCLPVAGFFWVFRREWGSHSNKYEQSYLLFWYIYQRSNNSFKTTFYSFMWTGAYWDLSLWVLTLVLLYYWICKYEVLLCVWNNEWLPSETWYSICIQVVFSWCWSLVICAQGFVFFFICWCTMIMHFVGLQRESAIVSGYGVRLTNYRSQGHFSCCHSNLFP